MELFSSKPLVKVELVLTVYRFTYSDGRVVNRRFGAYSALYNFMRRDESHRFIITDHELEARVMAESDFSFIPTILFSEEQYQNNIAYAQMVGLDIDQDIPIEEFPKIFFNAMWNFMASNFSNYTDLMQFLEAERSTMNNDIPTFWFDLYHINDHYRLLISFIYQFCNDRQMHIRQYLDNIFILRA